MRAQQKIVSSLRFWPFGPLGISIVPTVASDDSGAVSRAIGYPAFGTSRPQRGILIVAVDTSFRGYRLNLSAGDDLATGSSSDMTR